MGELYTMGYRAGWTPETLRMTMRESNAMLCDIRYMPHSRWHPEWNQGTLAKQFGSRYRHIKALGNRNYKNPGAPIDIVDLDDGIRQIEVLLSQFCYVIAMCGCPQLGQCHRSIVAHEANYRLIIPIRELHPPRLDGPQFELFMHKQGRDC